MSEKNKNVEFYGKIAKFPKNTKAKNAYTFLENIRIPKSRLWYFIIERELISKDNDLFEDLQIIKYNNKQGVDCAKFVESLSKFYENDIEMTEYVKNLVVEGSQAYSIIRNIPNVEINGKKLISILTEDLIRLLYK